MPTPSSALPRTIAVVRMATAVFFLFFGEYKVAGPEFAHGGFQQYLQGYIQGSAVNFFRVFLSAVIVPHAVFFGYFVGVLELAIGLSMLLGLWVRPVSVVGMIYMICLTLATWWDPGHGVPSWRYFGNELNHLPLLLLFVVFFTLRAGQVWGLDQKPD